MDTGIWKELLQRISIKNISMFPLQHSQDNLNEEIVFVLLGFSLFQLLNALDQSSLLRKLSQSMFSQRLWHHIKSSWFNQDLLVLFIALKVQRKHFISTHVPWSGVICRGALSDIWAEFLHYFQEKTVKLHRFCNTARERSSKTCCVGVTTQWFL